MTFPLCSLLLALGTLHFASSAFAAAAGAPLPGTTSESDQVFAGKTEFDYEVELKGSTIEHLDGNSSGRGADFQIRHYQDLGYELAKGWRLEGGTQFRQVFKPANPKKSDQRAVEFRDPYVGLGLKDFWRSGDQSLSGEAHYFLPVTDYNESNRGKADDEGRGLLHIEASYSHRLVGERLRLKAPLELNYRFAKAELSQRYDYWVGFKPTVAWKTGRATAVKAEYYTGDLNHHTSGSWTRLNDPKLGQTVALQLEWKPTDGTEITPEVKWGRQSFRFNAAELGLSAVFSFL
jgi:hypothetical protein